MVTKALPDSPDALLEELSNPERAAELMGDAERRKRVLDHYRESMNKADPELQQQLKEGREAGFKDFLERSGYEPTKVRGRVPMSESAAGSTGMERIYANLGLTKETRRQIAATGRGPGMALAEKWPSLAAYLEEINPKAIERNGIPAVLKDMSETVGADGGFLLPEEFRAELLMLALEGAVVRPRARVIPLGSATARIPSIRDASHASTVFGGVSASWIAEAASLATNTQPTFAQVVLTARKLTGYTVASNELLADSAISLEAIINFIFAEAIRYFEDDAFIQATGAGQPLGILNADALISVAKEIGQAATTLVYENIVKMYSRMLPQSLNRAVWIAHPDVFPQLASMAVSVGTGGSAVWVTNTVSGPPATIFGRPVILTEKAKTLGTAGDIYFADLGYYLIGDRQSLSMAASPHVNFNTDEMTWRFVQRVDGRPWLQTALTPRQGSNTLSPFVSLATRA